MRSKQLLFYNPVSSWCGIGKLNFTYTACLSRCSHCTHELGNIPTRVLDKLQKQRFLYGFLFLKSPTLYSCLHCFLFLFLSYSCKLLYTHSHTLHTLIHTFTLTAHPRCTHAHSHTHCVQCVNAQFFKFNYIPTISFCILLNLLLIRLLIFQIQLHTLEFVYIPTISFCIHLSFQNYALVSIFNHLMCSVLVK